MGDANNPNTTIIYHSYPVIQIIIHNENRKIRGNGYRLRYPKRPCFIEAQTCPKILSPLLSELDYVNVGEDTVLWAILWNGHHRILGQYLGCYSYNEVQMLQVDALTLEGNSEQVVQSSLRSGGGAELSHYENRICKAGTR